MKNLVRNSVAMLFVIAVSVASAAAPKINVTVSDSSGKAAFKGMTNDKGTFATANLKPGEYVVQFTSPAAPGKNSHYAIVVSAGAKKVTANGVAGEKFTKGGVAMKVTVASNLNITGQVAAEEAGATKNGKKMVWIPPQLGSNRPGHYVEEGSPEAVQARTSGSISTQDVQNMQSRGSSPGQ